MQHRWVSMGGAATAATSFTDFTAFGPDTIAQGGGAPIPAWAKGIDLVKIGAMSNFAAASGGVAGVRFNKGLYGGGAQYMLGPAFSGQTTSAEGCSVEPQNIKLDSKVPFLRPQGNRLQIGGCSGGVDVGQITVGVSVRFTDQPAPKPLWFGAAGANSTTDATALLASSLTALGGDTTLPVSVPLDAEGIRLIQTAFATDQAAAGDSLGTMRFQGAGLVETPVDLFSCGAGSESGAATGVAASPSDQWDDWLEVNPGNLIAAVFGYIGVDSGTETAAASIGFQLKG